jgi:peptidoglycan/xylan/chitin deacetylase (PgdA/CDA1 family)
MPLSQRRSALIAALVAAGLAPAAGQPPPDPGVSNLRACFALCTAPRCAATRVVLRHFEQDGQRRALVVDPSSLTTEIEPLNRLPAECGPWPAVRAALSGTRYDQALADAERNQTGLQDAGIVHALPSGSGVVLTVDLCPSRRPLDRSLFQAVIDEFEPEERPVPLGVAVTGVWMAEHPDDLAWLLDRVNQGDAAITWINHSFSHRFVRGAPLASNFLLRPGTDLEAEILRTEQAMLEHGVIPSVFFRFPGLVSSRALFDRVVAHGLVPVGSDAWLAKGQRPAQGSIVLVHGNGNEPLGVKEFLQLVHAKGPGIRGGGWLLLDLRQSAVPGATTPAPRIP